jgi:hypothetical protein
MTIATASAVPPAEAAVATPAKAQGAARARFEAVYSVLSAEIIQDLQQEPGVPAEAISWVRNVSVLRSVVCSRIPVRELGFLGGVRKETSRAETAPHEPTAFAKKSAATTRHHVGGSSGTVHSVLENRRCGFPRELQANAYTTPPVFFFFVVYPNPSVTPAVSLFSSFLFFFIRNENDR